MKQWIIIILMLCVFLPSCVVCATQTSKDTEKEEMVADALMKRTEIHTVDRCLKELFPKQTIHFQNLVKQLISGNYAEIKSMCEEFLTAEIFYVFAGTKKSLGVIFTLAILGAIYRQLMQMNPKMQMMRSGNFVIYMLVVTVSLSVFFHIGQWVADMIRNLTSFMKVFYPVYFVFVAISKGSISAASFYQIELFLIMVMETIIGSVFLQGIHLYMAVCFMNQMLGEGSLEKLCELIETIISWGMKTIIAGMIGLHVIQGVLGPSLDQVKRGMVTKGIHMIPGMGDLIGGSAEIFLAMASLVKNGVGIGGFIVCIFICMTPLLQVAFAALSFHFMGAMLQPIADPAIVNCMINLSVGCKLLVKVICAIAGLFFMTIIIISVGTNHV